MAQVFVVSTGSYSDWSILAICSTAEKAQAVAEAKRREQQEKYGYNDVNDIDIYELDDVADRIARGEQLYRVTWKDDFQDVDVYPWGPFGEDDKKVNYGWWDKRHQTFVTAKSDEVAKKVALGRYIQWKAGG